MKIQVTEDHIKRGEPENCESCAVALALKDKLPNDYNVGVFKGGANDDVYFDIIEETLNRTTLGNVGVGDYVNVERSLRVGDELGGHILSGHVMTTAKIIEKVENEGSIDLLIENKEEFSDYILEKGYVAIDGMSLTIGEVSEEWFSLHIIPETLRVTTIESKSEGDRVNIEIDSRTQAIVDTIRKMGVSS